MQFRANLVYIRIEFLIYIFILRSRDLKLAAMVSANGHGKLLRHVSLLMIDDNCKTNQKYVCYLL